MLEIKNATLSFGEKTILDNFSFTLAPGQRLALMGPSGCGKTTLLRVIAGLQAVSSGTVTNTFSKTAVMFQEPRLLPWCTAEQNVSLVSSPEKAAHYLTKLQLQKNLQQYPATLSGGMQQRVALARALAYEWDFLLLDEPFKAMDKTLRQQVAEAVCAATRNAAVLLVTHDPWEAEALGCQVLPFPVL